MLLVSFIDVRLLFTPVFVLAQAPSRVLIVESFPMTPSQKIKKRDLRALYAPTHSQRR